MTVSVFWDCDLTGLSMTSNRANGKLMNFKTTLFRMADFSERYLQPYLFYEFYVPNMFSFLYACISLYSDHMEKKLHYIKQSIGFLLLAVEVFTVKLWCQSFIWH